jgi:glycosyltransferase involved in cell wall biosynthesis
MNPDTPSKCLSVVMPCFNERETIQECVAAVVASPWVGELIIVDDGSTDGTRDLLSEMQTENVRVIFHQKNGGKGSALRTGFKSAMMPYVIVQDADL